MPNILQLNRNDNVILAIDEIEPGTYIDEYQITTGSKIPAGHKVAIQNINQGDVVRKYDQIIGIATQDIHCGDHVHIHNIESQPYSRDHRFGEEYVATELLPESERMNFLGIKRADGRIATRNYIGVISTVNCSASVCQMIANHFTDDVLSEWPNVDGVAALTHSTGCGIRDDGGNLDRFQRTLRGYATHPNFAGILVLGLGCESGPLSNRADFKGLPESEFLRLMTIQDEGGARNALARGIESVKAMMDQANKIERVAVPVSNLILGLQCGGSDAYSGISANPALGYAVDLLVKHGGTAALAETPEIYGAEHLLTRRARSPEVGQKLVSLIEWWEDFTARNNTKMDNNPSAGNQAGGLSTIYEKSLGAIAKGGTTSLNGVFGYAEAITEKGFVFMDSPGYDPMSITGLVAGGANICCFTTGRGSVFGSKPAPTLKLATNTRMYDRMQDDMDINCGRIVDGSADIETVGTEIFNHLIAMASGQPSKSEEFGMGDHEFVPWRLGGVV